MILEDFFNLEQHLAVASIQTWNLWGGNSTVLKPEPYNGVVSA